MSVPLRMLLIEDNPSDAELVFYQLRHAGYDPIGDCVETEQDYREHLQPALEIILADFSLPQFDALRALAIMHERHLDIPFILVSGTIGDERAVQVMQSGATDYVIKDRLGRLGQAVASALEKKLTRDKARLAEQRLRAQHAVTQALAESSTLLLASSKILEAICLSVNWDFGVLWQVDDRENVLSCVECWCGPRTDLADFEASTRQSVFAPGISVPGRIWTTGLAVWGADAAQDLDMQRAPHASQVGLNGAFGFPIILGKETLGILEFFGRTAKQPDDETFKMMLAVGSQIAQYIERKRAEASLLQSNQTLQALIQAAPLAIITLDQRSLVTMWNTAAECIFGWHEAEVLGRPVPLVPEGNRDIFSPGIQEAAKNSAGRELRLLHKNGTLLDVNLWTAPVTNAQGLVIGSMDLFLDVSGNKSLEAQFRQSQKMEAVGQLAAGVAHDFNNLLSIILGYTELLLTKLPLGDPRREALSQIRTAADRAAGLTRQLLAFGRKQILAPIVLDLNHRVTELDKMLRRLIGEDVELKIVLEPDLGMIKADPGQVEQIIMNLVVNARDAMPKGGHLTIETLNTILTPRQVQEHPDLPPGPYSMMVVSDTGTGMDEATKARIFEPFFTTKEIGKGSGLGLATVFGIVKQTGGFIEVDSAIESGSVFRTYLPQISEVRRLKGSDHGVREMPRGKETILLVEDEDGLRELAQLLLEASGYKVLSTRNGPEAVAVCNAYDDVVDLLFTDVVMPKMSGRQLADILAPSRVGMKVLYMSGYTDDRIMRHGIQDAATNFLPKPFTPVALSQKVREVLDRTSDDQNTVIAEVCPPSAGPVCAT